MQIKSILFSSIIICFLFLKGICQEQKSDITIDFSRIIGKVRPLNGVNNGPFVVGVNADLSSYHKEARFPYTRLHDCRWPNPM